MPTITWQRKPQAVADLVNCDVKQTTDLGHSNLSENQKKVPKSTSISVLIDQFSCKNSLIKPGGY